ncbi:uncharacterized protein HKW66_Vig0074580 [Vigna angularis]|uniref:Uncharacterized protein n=1 Tax=Phaseolus angularis TaxID=3914 RepID=A0A8T0K6D1_PHAAN|nr:uncharacterized protein HKW66_Vig0074580 [Vigna angularis]
MSSNGETCSASLDISALICHDAAGASAAAQSFSFPQIRSRVSEGSEAVKFLRLPPSGSTTPSHHRSLHSLVVGDNSVQRSGSVPGVRFHWFPWRLQWCLGGGMVIVAAWWPGRLAFDNEVDGLGLAKVMEMCRGDALKKTKMVSNAVDDGETMVRHGDFGRSLRWRDSWLSRSDPMFPAIRAWKLGSGLKYMWKNPCNGDE